MTLGELRQQYQLAVKQEEAAIALWQALENYDGPDAVTLAYKASARSLMAQHLWNPLEKLSQAKESMRLFRKAVRLDPKNLEVRFLRFAIQHSVPAILDIADERREDKAILIDRLGEYANYALSYEHVLSFLDFFKETGRFKRQELEKLQAQIH
ncbi:MAG: hypothetical protein AAF927_02730 [Bacteroidota bacterium]